MKNIGFFIISLLLCPSLEARACIVTPFDLKTLVACPEGTEKEIINLGLEIELEPPLKCHVESTQTLEDEAVQKVTAYYAPGDCAYFRETSFIVNSEGFFQSIPKHEILHSHEIEKFATQELKTPVGSVRSNLWLRKNMKWGYEIKSDHYCYVEYYEFPFKGALYSCPKSDGSKEYEVVGDISYVDGLFQWQDAYERAVLECPKYENALCYPNRPSLTVKDSPWYYGLNSRADSWVLLSVDKDAIEGYLFTMPIRKDHEAKRSDGMILIKVDKSGRVQSQEIESDAYKEAEIIPLAEKLFSDKN